MSSRFILFIGFIVSIIYVVSVLYVYAPAKSVKKSIKHESAKFLYVLTGKNVDIVSKLSEDDRQSSLVLTLKSICKKYKCEENISFNTNINSPSWIRLIDELISFSLEKNLNSSSLIVKDNTLEISFGVQSEDDLSKLTSIYDKYRDDFSIIDKSSLVKFYSIQSIEDELNDILKKSDLKLVSLEVSENSVKILNQVFKRVKELGKIKVSFFTPLSDVDALLVRDYILKNYSWVKELDLKNSKEYKIKIEEVLR